MALQPVIALTGPTACGKTSLAVDTAVRLLEAGHLVEIVNADSMLVYRGMDIGTAKPTEAQRRGVPHHLIDILEVTQTASVADFQRLARLAIDDCRRRGVLPLVVGGSALYLRAILDVFEFPRTEASVRAKYDDLLETLGPEALHARLAELSAEAAAQILPGNGRRIVRALEVIELTGAFRPNLPEWTYALDDVVQVGLELDRAQLDERIAARVDQMWRSGLLREVEELIPRGLRDGRTASRALGYRQVLDHLDGLTTLDEARELTISGTRRFARKQLGWWRRDRRIHWLPALDPATPARLMDLIRQRLGPPV